MRDDLMNRVVLPPIRLVVSKNPYLSDHHRLYINEYTKSAAIFEYWVKDRCRNSDDPEKLAIMMQALKNWEQTCDNLILSPHFSAEWRVPVFFVV